MDMPEANELITPREFMEAHAIVRAGWGHRHSDPELREALDVLIDYSVQYGKLIAKNDK